MTAQQEAVTDGQVAMYLRREQELRERFLKGVREAKYTLDGLQALQEGRAFEGEEDNWLRKILTQERKAHLAFFNQTFDLTAFKQKLREYGEERIRLWKSLRLEVHFLPEVEMTQDAEFPGWKVKPEKWFYQGVALGQIKRLQPNGELVKDKQAHKLEGIVFLIDTRCKPPYQDGKQMWENDEEFMGPIIERLRQQGKLAEYEYGPQSSRFGISVGEWEEHIKPTLAKFLSLKPYQVRLERTIEANVIPQLYLHLPRKNDGQTNTWVCYEEFFRNHGRRLNSDNLDYGGLANVNWFNSSILWRRSVRPSAVL